MMVVLGGTDAEGIEAATRSFTMIALRAPQLGPGNGGLFAETAAPRTTGTPPGGTLFRQRWVTINFDRLRETLPTSVGGTQRAQTLALNLFPDAQFVAVLNRVERTATGYVWGRETGKCAVQYGYAGRQRNCDGRQRDRG